MLPGSSLVLGILVTVTVVQVVQVLSPRLFPNAVPSWHRSVQKHLKFQSSDLNVGKGL